MASDNETVADIVSKVRSGDYGCAKCGDLCDCPNADKIIASIVDRIEAAHRREVAELTAIINAECRKCGECAKFGKDCTAGDNDGAEDNRACEKFVSKEVAELRECLNEAVFVMQTLFDKQMPKWRKALEGTNHELH